jgi:hypothetical protein
MTTGKKLSGRSVAGLLGVLTATAMSVSACGVPLVAAGSGGASSSGSHSIDVCELVPPSQVAALTGHKVVHASHSRGAEYPYQKPNIFTCSYSLSNGNVIRILVEDDNSKLVFGANEANLNADAFTVARVHGIGEEAGGSNRGLAVRTDKNNLLITSDFLNQWNADPAGLIALARNMISALD